MPRFSLRVPITAIPRALASVLWCAVAILALTLAACLQPAALTDATGGTSHQSADTTGPVSSIVSSTTPVRLELGDSLTITASDSGFVRRMLVFLIDSTGGVAWRSDTLRVNGRVATLRIPVTADTSVFPFATPLSIVTWAQDSSGNARYGGAPDSAATSRVRATHTPLIVTEGHTLRLAASQSRVGGVAYDPTTARAYYTDSVTNVLQAFDLVTLTRAPWSLRIGSQPTAIALYPTASGAGAVILNNGGTELTHVLAPRTTAPTITAKWVLPINVVSAGSARQYRPLFDAQAMFVYCPATGCAQPTLYLSSRASRIPPDTGAVPVLDTVLVSRSFQLSAANPMHATDVIAPLYTAQFSRDTAVNVALAHVDRGTLAVDTTAFHPGVSQCATLGVGSTMVVTPRDPGGPIFVGDAGGQRLCGSTNDGSSGRLLRLERQFGETMLSAAAILNTQADGRLRGVALMTTNADGSRLAFANAERVLITDADLRLLGTISTPSPVTALAFHSADRAGVPRHVLAVATTGGVWLYDTDAFRAITSIVPREPIRSPLVFTGDAAAEGVVIGGPLATGAGFWFVRRMGLPTTPP